MKTVIASLILGVVGFGSLAASAEPINLQPGSSVVIDGQIIKCEGQTVENFAPVCSIRQDGSKYRLYADENVVNTYWYFNEALKAAQDMKASGFCR